MIGGRSYAAVHNQRKKVVFPGLRFSIILCLLLRHYMLKTTLIVPIPGDRRYL